MEVEKVAVRLTFVGKTETPGPCYTVFNTDKGHYIGQSGDGFGLMIKEQPFGINFGWQKVSNPTTSSVVRMKNGTLYSRTFADNNWFLLCHKPSRDNSKCDERFRMLLSSNAKDITKIAIIDDTKIACTLGTHQTIEIYDANHGLKLQTIRHLYIKQPTGICAIGDDLIVTDIKTNSVSRVWLKSRLKWYTPGIYRPTSVIFYEDLLLVTSLEGSIYILATETGAIKHKIVEPELIGRQLYDLEVTSDDKYLVIAEGGDNHYGVYWYEIDTFGTFIDCSQSGQERYLNYSFV